MRLCWVFRSLPDTCLSNVSEPVNVPGWLNRHHPGNPGSRQENRRFAIPSSYSLRLSGPGACNVPVNAPSPRIRARRPGLRETTRRFTAGPEHCCYSSHHLDALLADKEVISGSERNNLLSVIFPDPYPLEMGEIAQIFTREAHALHPPTLFLHLRQNIATLIRVPF